MSEDDVVLQSVTENELEQQLYNRKKLAFHTEVANPLAFTALDLLEDWLKPLKLHREHHFVRLWLRVNYVAYKRKRADETVKVAVAEREKKNEVKTLSGVMLGKSGE